MSKTVAFDLGTLFIDEAMFDSRKTWRRAGFTVLDPAKETEVMVASHPSAPGVLFKKYADDVSRKEQNKNYEARLEGARRLCAFIEAEALAHVVVPEKRLHELPRTFGKDPRVLIVDRLDVVGYDESVRRYHDIAEPMLRDLLAVLVRFRGLDSNAKNVQFTADGKIAFIDLENWNRPDRKTVRLKSIGRYLSKDRRKLAEKILGDLE